MYKKEIHSQRWVYRIIVLQAENEQEMNEWVSSIRTASQQALNSDNAPRYTQQSPNLRKVKQCNNAYHSLMLNIKIC